MLAIPLDGTPQAVAQLHLGSPSGQLSQLRRVDELAIDLAGGAAAATEVGLDAGTGRLGNQLDHLPDRMWPVTAGVECLSGGAVIRNGVGDREVGADGVVDV